MPGFKVNGKTVAGFAALKAHCSHFPQSGSVIAQVPEAAPYATTKGTLQFPADQPLSKRLVRRLITVRMQQLGLR